MSKQDIKSRFIFCKTEKTKRNRTGRVEISFLFFVLFFLCVCVPVAVALIPKVPRTEKKYFIHVQPLTELRGGNDGDTQPTLLSLTETTTLWLPRGSTEDNDEHLSFNEDLDPFWVHILRRRHFELLEWSGCGGIWRPDWRETLYRTNSSISDSARELIYTLSHHTVCYYSGLSACGWNSWDTMSNDSAKNSFADSDVEARRHHQWLSQFVSSMLSSPLSWSKDTPRHIRPVGVLSQVNGVDSVVPAAGNRTRHWCSFHLAQRDTLCTQHVAAFLRGGRSKKVQEENIPDGIFRAGLVTVQQFFSSSFHHFYFSVSQSPVLARNSTEEAKINLLVRMAFVAEKGDFDELKEHWKLHLPSYANRLTFFAAPDTDVRLNEAIKFVMTRENFSKVSGGDGSLADKQVNRAPELAPKAGYYLSLVGHDRGTYRLIIHPPDAAKTVAGKRSQGVAAGHGLKVGDVLHSLLVFPLHVIRPSLHEMRSDEDGLSVLENAFFDDSSNVLFVLLKTVVTQAHLRKFVEVSKMSERPGFVICEFPFRFGWAALKDMPFDANSYRIIPQPAIRVTRYVLRPDTTSNLDNSVTVFISPNRSSPASLCFPFSSMRIDHQESLERLLNSFILHKPLKETVSPSVCHYWIRCNNVAGTTIPVPDPAMVFNAVSLGLVFSGILTSGMARITRLLVGMEKWE